MRESRHILTSARWSMEGRWNYMLMDLIRVDSMKSAARREAWYSNDGNTTYNPFGRFRNQIQKVQKLTLREMDLDHTSTDCYAQWEEDRLPTPPRSPILRARTLAAAGASPDETGTGTDDTGTGTDDKSTNWRKWIGPKVHHDISNEIDNVEREVASTPKVTLTTSPSDSTDQAKLVFDAGKGSLFYTLSRREDDNMPKTAVLNIATLQKMVMQQLQVEIAGCVAGMYDQGRMVESTVPTGSLGAGSVREIAELLRLYTDAEKNLEHMKHCAIQGYSNDPYLMKSSRALDRQTMEAVGLIPNHVLPKGALPPPYDHEHPLLRGLGRNQANRMEDRRKRLLRFIMAASGGMLVMVPMIIMTNIPGKVAALVTSCVSILVFSALITFVSQLSPNEVLGTTAAYAAVLVVFVGISLAPVASHAG